uniref:NADH dehydrogenase subunit 6 n=1 Tax=Pachycephus smyrnensis TaxID=1090887 RepID=UPI002176DAA6|nr:NADH dehydrogenase subunit 6 [Pachycephus smyrnensis]UTY22582.1 NADH dehydrogenase subunit 6 [Pachycephus smyrnensis]
MLMLMNNPSFNLIMMMQFLSKMFIFYTPLILITIMLSLKLTHPITMMISLISISIFTCLNMSIMNKNSWFSYMLFLTMIGGLLILFLYFVSTSSNEKIYLFKLDYLLTTIMMSTMVMMILITNLYFDLFSIMSVTSSMNNNLIKMNNFNWSNLLHFNSFQMFNISYKITIMIMTFLLFVMFSLMKMCMKLYGPLRQFM